MAISVVVAIVLITLALVLLTVALNWGTITKPSTDKLIRTFRGKNVILTGGASGIGKEICIQLASLGSKVFVLDKNPELIQSLKSDLESLKLSEYVEIFQSDVSDRERLYKDLKKISDSIQNSTGSSSSTSEAGEYRFDYVISNAGIVFGKSLEELEDVHIERTISVNLLSNFWIAKAVLPSMKKRGKGHIVFVSSVAGLVGMSNMSDYCASKFGLFGFAESLRRELWKDYPGIIISTVCPWAIATGMFSGMGRVVLPALDPPHTAKCIIYGMCNGCRLIPIPWYMRYVSLMRFMPESVADYIGYLTNAMSASQTIQGRGADWNMAK